MTAAYKYLRVIEFIDELPKTISGKIRRVEGPPSTATKTLKEDLFYGDIALCPYISLSLIFPRENFP